MQIIKKIPIIVISILCCNTMRAQSAVLPAAIDDLFYAQYPYASNIKVEKKNNLTLVNFLMKRDTYLSVYEGGEWKYSLMDYNYKQLPLSVRNNYKASKYATLNVTDTKVFYMTSGFEQYRLLLNPDNEHPKGQYLFFNESGHLVRHETVR